MPKPRTVDLPPDALAPADWRSLPVFPTHQDLGGESLQLSRGVTQGTYAHGDQYLMTQFLLTREDMVAPLRLGVAAYQVRCCCGTAVLFESTPRV